MSTSPKVKLIIPIENGDAQQTYEHLRNCMTEIHKLSNKGHLASEVIFKPKTNSLSPENYDVYKSFFHELQAKIDLLPVLLIDANVDVSLGLLAEQAAILVIDEKKGSVSQHKDHSDSLIGKDLQNSALFSGVAEGKSIHADDLDDDLMIETLSTAVYLKYSEQMGMFDLQYLHNQAAVSRLGKVLDFDQRRESRNKDDDGIQLA